MATTGKITVTGGGTLDMKAVPDPKDETIFETVADGTPVIIKESRNGYYQCWSADGNYILGYAPTANVIVDNSNTQMNVSKTDATVISDTSSSSQGSIGSTSPSYLSSYSDIGTTDGSGDDLKYYLELSDKYIFALGYPPKYNMDVDLQYQDQDAETLGEKYIYDRGHGRVYQKTYLSNPPILSICPGTVKMFPHLFGNERDTFIEKMVSLASGNSDLIDKIMKEPDGKLTGKLYEFEADTNDYANYVNILCRACAILLGIGDETIPYNGAKLKDFDYTYMSLRTNYNIQEAIAAAKDGSIFRIYNKDRKRPTVLSSLAVDEYSYVNFFLNGTEVSVSEDIHTDTSDSPLSEVFGGINDIAAKINYFTGSGFQASTDDIEQALQSVMGGGDMGLYETGMNFIRGGKLILPRMMGNSTYGKSININLRFMSPYGNKYSVFLRCLVPIMHLLAFTLPKQLSENMYGYPFMVRANQVGSFHCDLGVVSNISINRGGSDETAWTVDGLPTEYDINLTIEPLVDELMITSANHPLLFCKNDNLIDYLGMFCGFDLLANNEATRLEFTTNFIKNMITDIPASLQRRSSDQLHNKLKILTDTVWTR